MGTKNYSKKYPDYGKFFHLEEIIRILKSILFTGTTSPNPFDLGEMGSTLPPTQLLAGSNTGAKPKNSVHTLLGEHSNLVNLDNLVTDSKNAAGKQILTNLFKNAKNHGFSHI